MQKQMNSQLFNIFHLVTGNFEKNNKYIDRYHNQAFKILF